jgi:hypothetical protein
MIAQAEARRNNQIAALLQYKLHWIETVKEILEKPIELGRQTTGETNEENFRS